MSQMTDKEAMERFDHGLRQAADLCRKLARVRSSNAWKSLATQFDGMRENGRLLANKKPLSQNEVLKMLDKVQDKERAKADAQGRTAGGIIH